MITNYGAFPERGVSKIDVLSDIDNICSNDYKYTGGRILNSICTEPLDIAVEAYVKAIYTNLGDSRIFPGVKKLEFKIIEMIGELLGKRDVVGNIVSGGTEANLLALYVAREIGYKRNINCPEMIAPESIHYSVNKAAAILGIKVHYTALDGNQRAVVEEIESSITPNTVAIMATAGTSELGIVDPIPEIAAIAKRNSIYFHVDAASGGFIIPFAKEIGYKLPDFDFSVDGVDSITIDPHKYGLSVIPAGCIVFRTEELQKNIEFESYFIGTQPHTTFLGTRSGASVASIYSVIKHLGRKGFIDITRGYFEKRDYLISLLKDQGLSITVCPDLNIVTINSKSPYAVMNELENRRWLVSLSRRCNSLRVVVHKHTQKEELCEFVKALYNIENSI